MVNILYHFCPANASVVDPMAGGGSTHDVIQWMNTLKRNGQQLYHFECTSFDLNPSRDFIVKKDALEENWKVDEVDLVFLDPPYFSMKKEDYVDNAFTESRESFFEAITVILKKAYFALKPGGLCALIIQPQTEKDIERDSGEVMLDTPYECQKRMEYDAGFEPFIRIQVPLSTQQFNATDMKRVKEYDERSRLLGTSRDLIIMRKPE